jgi:hypothetical protein
MMNDQSFDTRPTVNGSTGSSMNDKPMDTTEMTFMDDENPTAPTIPALEYGEVSFPSSEQLRDASTSRTGRRSVWSGSASNKNTTNTTVDNNRYTRPNRRHICVVLMVVVVIVLLLVVTPVVVVRNHPNTSNPNYDDVLAFIIGQRISLASDFDNIFTPQSQAMYWLVNEDPAKIPVPLTSNITTYEGYMYMVRYVMAVNYFSFSGYNWMADLSFLSEKDVCNWNDEIYVDNIVKKFGLLCATTGEEGNYQSLPIMLRLGTFVLYCLCI